MIFKKEISKDTFYNAISPEITPKYTSTTSSKATASAATKGTAAIEQKIIFDEKTGNHSLVPLYEFSRDKTVIVITGNHLYKSNHFRKNS